MDIINTCLYTTGEYRPLALYSHILPIAIALFLSTFAVFRAKFSLLTIAFFLFCLSFSAWLVGDLVTWVSNDYQVVQTFWSWLDYTSILYFVFGAIFFALLIKKDLHFMEKIFFIGILIFPYVLTFSGNSVMDFNLFDCEVQENELLTEYKFVTHFAILAYILINFIYFFRRMNKSERIRSGVILFAILLFLGTASITEYISSVTYIYEVNLYGMLVLPIALIILVFAVTNLGLFQFRLLGSQILAYILILTVGSQFMFLQNATERTLSIATFVISVIIAILFLQNSTKETNTRKKVEQLAEQLNQSNEKLKELDKQKSEFISIASHQLRTPLTAIKGYISLLLEGSYGVLNKDVNDVLNKVYSVNDRLVHLVEDLLNVSRIEAGRIQYNFQPTQLADLLTELHDMFGVTAKNKGLEFTLSLPESMLPLIMADPNKIKEICSNLIDNAIKYTPKGSVKVSLERVGPNARITIIDTGIGIKPEDKDNLFTKFVRSKETSRMVVGGAGLGLYVGKSFVLAHKGNIWAESEGPGKGSKFIIEIPVVNPDLKAGTIDKKQEA